jgi:uncharacterized protein (DUF927 family)
MTEKDDPFKRLSAEAGKSLSAPPPPGKDDGEPVFPVPSSAPPPPKAHKAHGEASKLWAYRDVAGAVLGYVARFDKPDGSKVVLPLTYRKSDRGLAWRWKGWPDPRPLYGLDRLAVQPDVPVLVVEGEKAADAGAALFPDYIVICWQGGSNAVSKADWSPLSGRRVAILPDADEAGLKAAKAVRGALVKLGVVAAGIVLLPERLPKGWDVADPFPAGFSLDHLQALIAAQLNPVAETSTTDTGDEGWPASFSMNGSGLWYQPRNEDAKPQWVSGPFEVLGEARTSDGEGWSVVISFKDRDGRGKTAILSKGKLANGWSDLRRDLADMGLKLLPRSPNSFDPLPVCLLNICSDRRITLCGATGWEGKAFVLPNEVIGATTDDPALFTGEAKALHFQRSGDLITWQREIAARAVGNTRATFCLSLAFAGPLLKLMGLESGGFHIRGGSSSGKSTLAMAAGSVWGGGGPLGFAQSWRSTSNALEGTATGHSDVCLILDELAQLAPDEAGNAAYMLSNGQGKARLKSDGTARSRSQWRCVFLSTGEISLSDHIKAAKNGGNVMTGMEVRVLDLLADAGRGHGTWEDLHEFASGAEFSDNLKHWCRQHYGHAGPAFIRALIAGGNAAVDKARAIHSIFMKRVRRDGDTGQVDRGAFRFALAAAAGELATEFGIVPWEAGQALGAAQFLFDGWAKSFGRTSIREEVAVLRRLVDTIQANMARFGSAGDDDFEVNGKGPRAGEARSLTTLGIFGNQKVEGESEDCYLFYPGGWAETFSGMDRQFAARVLKANNYLVTEGEGRLQKKKKIKGQVTNMYWVRASVLSHDFGEYIA